MENVARIQLTALNAATPQADSERNPKKAILSKILAFIRALFAQPDLDYATFERLESKRTPQEMRRNRLY